jgi:hypothetical protein
MRVRRLLGLSWWNGRQLNLRKFHHNLKRLNCLPGRAWIICLQESDAAKICALWDALANPPFVLHVMDIFHHRISDSETPNFRRLVREARHVICISQNIADEMLANGARSVGLLPPCTSFSPCDRKPYASPLKLLMSGAIWQNGGGADPALDLLGSSWKEIKSQFPGMELHYAGLHASRLPEVLRAELRDHGLLGFDAYQRLLKECHVAYLPVSHLSHTFARFSLPSRLVDYLACGLPLLGFTDRGTAIHAFLRDLPQGCAAIVSDKTGLLAALANLACDPGRWALSSARASEYARQHFTVSRVRAELWRQLDQPGCSGE